MNRLIAGNQAPAFTLLNQQESPISLSDFRGKKCLSIFILKHLPQVVRVKHVDYVIASLS